MNVLPPVLSQHADELIAALQRSLCAADGRLLWKARPIPPDDARRIATHVQGFMVEVRALPYLGVEIDRRARLTEETLPAGLTLDGWHGCVWLRDAEAKSVEALVRTYQDGMGAVKLRPIYDAVMSLLPWAKQHAPPAAPPTTPPAAPNGERTPGDDANAARHSLDPNDIVETGQIAALVRKHNKTVLRWLAETPLILPHSEGGGGDATLWRWSDVRERIAEKSRRDMPEQFTGNI